MKNIVFLFLILSINSFGQTIVPKKFIKSSIKLEKVEFELFKGTISVKIDHSDSSSGYLTLPVHIIKSPSQSPREPIYWLEGGPGGSNMKLKPPKALLANHDFVLIGYRGADGSVTMYSKKLDKAIKGLHNNLFSNEALDEVGIKIKQYSEDLNKKGIDINHFTILDVIDDFEYVRVLLGHKKINLYSMSYGTRVALLYSYRYPDVIKRSVMVGVNPPGYFVWHPEATKRIIQKYDSIYKKQSGPEDISFEESIKQSFERMPKRWSFYKLDAGKIKIVTFIMFFSKGNAAMVFDAYRRAALKGDYSGLYLMQWFLERGKSGLNGDLFSKAVSADYDPDVDYRKSFLPDSLEIGSPFSLLAWGVSNNWPIKLIDNAYRKPRICNTETLMVGGNLDISTPSENATEKLMPYMLNGKQVILADMAHCGDLAWSQYDAFNYMSLKYFDEGIVDTSKFKQEQVNFKPKKSLNKMAKWLYPVVLVTNIF